MPISFITVVKFCGFFLVVSIPGNWWNVSSDCVHVHPQIILKLFCLTGVRQIRQKELTLTLPRKYKKEEKTKSWKILLPLYLAQNILGILAVFLLEIWTNGAVVHSIKFLQNMVLHPLVDTHAPKLLFKNIISLFFSAFFSSLLLLLLCIQAPLAPTGRGKRLGGDQKSFLDSI